jgi:hypothetical protein
MALPNTPLFQVATKAAQAALRRQFERSDYGRLLNDVKRSVGNASVDRNVKIALAKYKRSSSPTAAIKSMMGSDFGQMVSSIERYAKGGSANRLLVEQFLDTLGPAGKLVSSLVNSNRTTAMAKQLQQAMELIRAFGGEVMPGDEWGTTEDVRRGLLAAQKRLEQLGYPLAVDRGPPRRQPQPEPGRTTVDVGMGGRGDITKRLPANHPLVTGEMVQAYNSSNVFEFGYDNETATLYVRFQTSHDEGARGGAGSLYAYYGVTPAEFLALYATRGRGNGHEGDSTPGTWVWSHLRERGTVSGHQKDYRLAGITSGYVPRKATIRAVYETTGKRGQPLKRPRKTGVEEWYVQRSIKTHEGRSVQSVLPTTRVVGPMRPK